MRSIKVFSAILLLAFIISCQNDEVSEVKNTSTYYNDVATSWVSTALEMVKASPGFSPPVAARSFGYLGLAMYEAGIGGMPEYKSMEGQVADLNVGTIPRAEANKNYNWALVVNASASEVLHACMDGARAENIGIIDAQLEQQTNNFKSLFPVDVTQRSLDLGHKIGKAIISYAATDNQVECYKSNFPIDFIAQNGFGLWVPTSAQKIPLQPYWGQVRSFAPGNPDVQVAPPIPFSEDPNSDFYREAKEVYDASKSLNARDRTIAEFWSDDPGNTATPPGHSMSIAKIVLKKQNANLANSVETFAKVGMALHDAFVSCWKTKYQYNLIRPVTYINTYIDPTWTPILSTPPFPEYTSGHSVQSGAAAEVLENLFGTSFVFQDNTHALRNDINGTPRNYLSFNEFAQEAAISRFYGGIHYKKAIIEGVNQGRLVGKNILKLQFK